MSASTPCREHDGDLWFDETDVGMIRAVALCSSCPLIEDCLELAMSAERGKSPYSRYGVFGGLTPKQRYAVDRKIVRKRNAARRAAGGDA